MSKRLNHVIVSLLRPPLLVVGFVAKGLYHVFWGRADKRLAQRHQNELEGEIRQTLAFLFQEYGARVIPNAGVQFPPSFDYAIVTLEAGDLLFRFVRGRGDLDVQVTTKRAPNDWHDLALVIGAIENPDEMRPRTFVSLTDVARLLKPSISKLQAAFSGARYVDLQKQLVDFEHFARVVTKQLETEINRRLYS